MLIANSLTDIGDFRKEAVPLARVQLAAVVVNIDKYREVQVAGQTKT